jgi:RNA polymerase sigma-70 factor (ECF subfamily)
LNDSFDESVVRACRQGDKAAYALLVKKHYRHVFGVCYGMLARVHDAEDMAQEAMLKGFQNIGNLSKADQFESWILRIARNACIDFLRKQKRAARADDYSPQQAATLSDNHHDLEQAIRRLPQELRLPLTLYYFEQKNARSIGEMLGISHSLVCQRIREARNQLHEFLTERSPHEQRLSIR